MKYIIFILMIFGSALSLAFDCSQVKPFKQTGSQQVEVSVTKIFWNSESHQQFEDVCTNNISIRTYDVRNREEEAFYCLLPDPTEMLQCKVELDHAPGSILVVPASWIRKWNTTSYREYRFHAYATKDGDVNYLNDIFSRSLSANLKKQKIVIEGALKTGPSNPKMAFSLECIF